MAYEDGCSQGLVDSINETNSMVILDFGGQFGDLKETEDIEKTQTFTYTQIAAIAEEFGAGYLGCTGEDTTTTVTIAIGTNNDKEAVSSAGGKAWAGIIKIVATHVLENKTEAKQVAIWGGNDLEDGYSTGGAALNWAKGYEKVTSSPYVDYGSAGGCPETTHTNGKCSVVGGHTGWNQKVEAELAWRLGPARSTPEIYYNPPPGAPANAKQWKQIAEWNYYNNETLRQMEFEGPLEQNGAESSNTPEQAWTEFEEQLEELERSGVEGGQTYMEYLLTI